MRRRLFFLLTLNILQVLGCGHTDKHDVDAAGRLAVEFAQTAFIQNRAEQAYTMLSDGMKRHVNLTNFWITVARLHSDGYPTFVKLRGVTIERGERRMVYVFLAGEGTAGQRFRYRITMEGSADLGYKVAMFRRQFGGL